MLPGEKEEPWAAAAAAFASGVFSRMRKVKIDCSTFWLITGAPGLETTRNFITYVPYSETADPEG